MTRVSRRIFGKRERTVHAASIADLRARFRDALALLRHARPVNGKFAAWLDAVTGQYAYRLPWYLVIGSAGSGKTALVVHSGLDWSVNEHTARAANDRFESTAQCDWWFGNHAVLIDTPAHVLDSVDASSQPATEWRTLLGLLRKHRASQPLNGVLLTVAIDALIGLDPAGLAAYATGLRRPLQSLHASLGTQVPIYLCLTKMDRLAGFREYFAALSRDDREQVWGAAFPVGELATRGDASGFKDAFDRLALRLNEGLRDVVIGDPDLDSRALAYLFPQQFASLRDVLDEFCSTLFRTSRLEANLFARGVYFTSALQGGLVVDRVTETVRRELGGATGATVDASPPSSAISKHATQRFGQSYFLKQLLRDAILADAGIAGASRTSRRWRLFAHVAIAVSSAALLLALLTGWAISYADNRAYLDEVDAHVASFARHWRQPIALPRDALLPLVPMLDALHDLPHGEHVGSDAPAAFRNGFGLHPGAGIAAASETAYRRALDEQLLPLAASRLETLLSNAPPGDAEYSYDALKSYLMLHDAAHYDGRFIVAWLMRDAQTSLPPDITEQQRARLETHLSRLFGTRAVSSPFPLDAALVAHVRERLAQVPLAQRVYRQLRRQLRRGLLRTQRDATISMASAGGPQAALVFRRASGKPLSDGIDGLYTFRGYWHVFDKQVASAAARLRSEEPWVLGIDAAAKLDAARLELEVRRAYLLDYIDVWDAYLDDLTLVDSTSVAQSTRIARTLSATDSPLRQFLVVAARETNLSRADSTAGRAGAAPTNAVSATTAADGDGMLRRLGGVWRSLAAMFRGKAASESGASGASDTSNAASQPEPPDPLDASTASDSPRSSHDSSLPGPEAMVDEHFAALRRLVAASDSVSGATPLDADLHTLDALYSYLISASAALDGGNPPPSTDVFDKMQADAGRLPIPLRTMFAALSQSASAQLGGALRTSLAQDAQGGIGRLCRHMIAGRYPFARNSMQDVALDDFSRLFAPGGLMDAFFQQRLASQIDVSGNRWRFRRDATGNASGDIRLARAFENADIIRTAFFAGHAATPALRIELTPLELDPAIAQYTLDVDGQTLRYAHGPQMPATVQWPNPGGTGQASLQIVMSNANINPNSTANLNASDGQQTGVPTSSPISLQTRGPWALHRLLDKARVTPGATPESFVASFDFNGHKLSLRVTANSSYNPFRLPQMDAFSCPS